MNNWTKVYKFTFIQTIKGKFFQNIMLGIIVIAFFGIFLLNVIPAINYVEDDLDSISNIDVVSECDIDVEQIVLALNSYDKIEFKASSDSIDKLKKNMEKASKDKGVLYISNENGYYDLSLFINPKLNLSTESKAKLSSMVKASFESVRLANIGIQDQTILSNLMIDSQVNISNISSLEEKNTTINFMVKIIIAMIVMIVLMFFGDNIASSVAQEKFSKTIEVLLTSVKPMDIIIGKVLAITTIVLGEVTLLLASISLSIFGSIKLVNDINPYYTNTMIDMVNYIKDNNIFSHLSFTKILLCLLIFILGIVFFFFIASLIGAIIKKSEDVATGLLPYEMLCACGVIAIGYSNISSNIALMPILRYLPITSVYVSTADILLGNITINQALICCAILIVSIIVLVKVISGIYVSVILYNGQKITFEKFIKALKNN
ncbi:MAG: ABC transporter permease [Clostridium sp.]